VFYYAEGTVTVRNPGLESVGCTLSPTQFVVNRDTGSNTPGHGGESNQFVVDYGQDPPMAGGAGIFGALQTLTCPYQPPRTEIFYYSFFKQGNDVPLSADGLGFGDARLPFYSFSFRRP
jgi:hypothetical protein